MEALVVVHAEKYYLKNIGARCRRRNKELFERIGEEIGKVIDNKIVYFLAVESEHPYQKGMFPDISQYGTKIEFIPSGSCFEEQFLKTKQRMLEQGVTKAELAGISIYVCVNDMHCLLTGVEGDHTRMNYDFSRREMGWSEEEFREVFETKIDATVRKELTDRF